jgi:hypothetical protein
MISGAYYRKTHEDQHIVLVETIFSEFSQTLLGSGVSKHPKCPFYTKTQRQAAALTFCAALLWFLWKWW